MKKDEDELLDFTPLGYKCWDVERTDLMITKKYQTRIDTQERFKDIPLCQTNDKAFINIDASVIYLNGDSHTSYTFSVTQESNEIWCDIKFYSISEDMILKIGVDEFERRIAEVWKCNFFIHHTV